MYLCMYVCMYVCMGVCSPALYMSYCTSLLRNWKSTGKDFNLGEGNNGKRATIPLHGHCVYRSASNFLRCFCFSVSGKSEMFFTEIANTLLVDWVYKYGIKASYSMSEIVHASRLKRQESKLVENLTYCSGNQPGFWGFPNRNAFKTRRAWKWAVISPILQSFEVSSLQTKAYMLSMQTHVASRAIM